LQNPNGIRFRWATDDTLVFMSYRDGWRHLSPRSSGNRAARPLLLTPGRSLVEQIALSPDGGFIVYNANTGSAAMSPSAPLQSAGRRRCAGLADLRRGHRWNPVMTADGQTSRS
jgi:hypothetical protein